jgi:hypothetical protein
MSGLSFIEEGWVVAYGDTSHACRLCGARPAEKRLFELSNVHVLRRIESPVGKRPVVTLSLCGECRTRPRLQADVEGLVLRSDVLLRISVVTGEASVILLDVDELASEDVPREGRVE